MPDVAMLGQSIAMHAERSPTPAVAIAVFDTTRTLAAVVRGTADLTSGRPARPEDWWDLASLTKTLVTLPEVLALIDAGGFAFDQPLADAWPPARGHAVAEATIGQLLSFDAGMPGIVELFRSASGRDGIVEAALAVPLDRPIGSGAVYSDLSYLLLGEAVQLHTGRPLRDLALARSGLRFAPLPGAAVATELCRWRGRLIHGEVHDENAAAMGGVAGHAGAFGTLDLAVAAAQSWLAERVVSPHLHAQARRCWSMGRDGYRDGLGWWLDPRPGLGGPAAGPDGYGCTGFVGNRIWLEPASGYGVCVLSNRIHPDRTDPTPFLAWCDGLFGLVSAALQ